LLAFFLSANWKRKPPEHCLAAKTATNYDPREATNDGSRERTSDRGQVTRKRLEYLLGYLEDLGEAGEALSAETLAAIEEGLNDIRNGRTTHLKNTGRRAVCEIRNPALTPAGA
jgi:hypothetical protein